MSKRSPQAPASRTRLYVLGGVGACMAAALIWIYWPSGKGPQAPTEVESRAEEIAERIRKAEPVKQEPTPQAQQAAAPTATGPTNLRQRQPQPPQ